MEEKKESVAACDTLNIDSGRSVAKKKRKHVHDADTKVRTPTQSPSKRRLIDNSKTGCKSPKKRKTAHDDNAEEQLADDDDWKICKTEEEEREDALTDVANELAEKIDAKKISLSAANVKSILHHLLTDKLLVEFTQRVALDASDNDIQASNELGLETRITRSIWRKGKTGDSKLQPKFFETDLAEDSEDEEYHPEKENSMAPSDDESVTTNFSDQPSPFLPRTPDSVTASHKEKESLEGGSAVSQRLSYSDVVIEEGVSQDRTFKVPATPPSASKQKHDGDFDKETIAYRTRSKISMRELSLDALTETLTPPDYDPALYDFRKPEELDPDDLEWQSWLSNLFRQDELDESMEENDEDFNFMATEEEFDKEEFRTDKGVRITHKELEGLLDGILDDFGDNIKDQSTILKFVIPKVSLTAEQKLQLIAQLQQHVQLLTQSYILSYKDELLVKENNESKELLQELARFKDAVDGDENLRNNSAYCMPGLPGAIRIINTIEEQSELEKILAEKNAMPIYREAFEPRRGKRIVVDIPPKIALKIFSEPFFLTYPELLPHQGILATERLQELSKENARLKFFRCEDNLLAMGLAQFGKNYDMIAKHLLPIATPKQLYTRAKNLVSKREDDNNPVKVLRRTNCLPPLMTSICINIPRCTPAKSLKDSYHDVSKRSKLPLWVDKIHGLLNRLESGSSPRVRTPHRKPAPVYPTKFRPIAANCIIKQLPPLILHIPPPPVVKKKPSKATKIKTVSKAIQTELESVEPSQPAHDVPSLESLKDVTNQGEGVPLDYKVSHDVGISCELQQEQNNVGPDTEEKIFLNESTSPAHQVSSGKLICPISEPVGLGTTNQLQSEDLGIRPEFSGEKVLPSIGVDRAKTDGDYLADKVSDNDEEPKLGETTEPVINAELEFCLDNDIGSSPIQSNLESGNCSFDDDTEDYEDSRNDGALSRKEGHDTEEYVDVCDGIQAENGSGKGTTCNEEILAEQTKDVGNADEKSLGDKDSPKDKSSSRATANTRRKKIEKNENFNWNEKLQEKASKFADLYFEKVKETLSEKQELYCDFLRLIDEAGRQKLDRVEVYRKLSDLLHDYPELVEMFVGFLEPSQARDVGKFKTWLEFDKARNFLLSCEAFFLKTKHYHQLLRKKIRLHENENDSRKLFEALKSHFRGNNELLTELSTMLPDLSPPRSRSEDFEVIHFRPDQNGFDHVDEFEEIKLKPSDYLDFEDLQQKKKNILDDFAAWLQKPALNALEIRAEKHDSRKSDLSTAARNDAGVMPENETTSIGVGTVQKGSLDSKNVLVQEKLEVVTVTQFSDNSGAVAKRRPSLSAPQQTSRQISSVNSKTVNENHIESNINDEQTGNEAISNLGLRNTPGTDSKVPLTPVASTSEIFKSPAHVGPGSIEPKTNESVLLGGSSPMGTRLTTFRVNVHGCSPSTGFQRIGPRQEPPEVSNVRENVCLDSEIQTHATSSPASPHYVGDNGGDIDVNVDNDCDSQQIESGSSSEDKGKDSECVPADDVVYDDKGNVIYQWTR
eukprot:gene6233-11645_t